MKHKTSETLDDHQLDVGTRVKKTAGANMKPVKTEGLIRWFTFIKFKRVKTLLEQQRERESYREMYNFLGNMNVQLILFTFFRVRVGVRVN